MKELSNGLMNMMEMNGAIIADIHTNAMEVLKALQTGQYFHRAQRET